MVVYETMEYLDKERHVRNVRSLSCDVDKCGTPPQYQIQFADGMWMDVCLKHKPKMLKCTDCDNPQVKDGLCLEHWKATFSTDQDED